MRDRLFILCLVFIVCLTTSVNTLIKHATRFALQKNQEEFVLNMMMLGARPSGPVPQPQQFHISYVSPAWKPYPPEPNPIKEPNSPPEE